MIAVAVLFFGFAYFVKGGGMGQLVPRWDVIRDSHVVVDRLLDGKSLSTILVFGFVWAATNDVLFALTCSAGWLLAVAPSMGEEHGAVGRVGHAWGQYVTWMPTLNRAKFMGVDLAYREGRNYGIKKAIQRGVWMGACMTVATGYIPFLLFSLLFVPAVFVGQQVNWWVLKKSGWTLSEPLIGAAVFGLPMGIFLNSL